MAGMRSWATASPSAGGGGGGAAGAVVGTSTGSSGATVGASSTSPTRSSNSSSSEFWACASRMPVPHSWYTTNSRISTPAVMQTRPIAPRTLARRMSGAERTDPHAPPSVSRQVARRSDGAARSWRAERCVSSLASSPWSRSSTSATPLRCSDVSLRSPGSTSTWRAVRSSSSAGPTAQARPRSCARCAGLVPVVRGEARVLGHDLRVDARGPSAAGSGCWATPPASTTT